MAAIIGALFGGASQDPKEEEEPAEQPPFTANVLFVAPETAARSQESRDERMKQLLKFALPGEAVEVTEYNTVRAGDPMTLKLQRQLQELADPNGELRQQSRLQYPFLFGVYEEEGEEQQARYEFICGLDELAAANEVAGADKAPLQELLRRCPRVSRSAAAGGGGKADPQPAAEG